jgi:hypothetical protein
LIWACALNSATAGFEGLSYELVSSNGDNHTYRVYATFNAASDELVALYGTGSSPWSLSLTDTLYQSEFGGPLATSISAAGLGTIEGLAEDSWFTIGSADDAGTSTIQSVGVSEAFASFEAGDGFNVNSAAGGMIFIIPGSSTDATAGSDYRVLIAQFTTAGVIDITLNMQWRPEGGIMVYQEGVSISLPTEIGCTDAAACNYDSTALVDDGSCEFTIGIYYCDGDCLNDADDDGVCDEDETAGCTIATATNYDAEATDDDGSCIVLGCTDLNSDNYDPVATEDDGSCFVGGCMDGDALNYDEEATTDDGSCEYPEPSYTGISYELVATDLPSQGCYTHRVYANFTNPFDELVGLFGNANSPLTMVSGTAFVQAESGSGWAYEIDSDSTFKTWDSWLAIGTDTTEVQRVGMSESIDSFEAGEDFVTESLAGGLWFVLPGLGYGSPDSTGRVLLGQFTSTGLVELTLNLQYVSQGGSPTQVLQEVISFPDVPSGCTESDACNYDAGATVEDGSCEYLSCAGCMDELACNYDVTVSIQDDSCTYPETGLDCLGNCLSDEDGDGVCDENEVLGCTDDAASNFSANATDEDGSCMYPGCTNPDADNYNSDANQDDGSCALEGCMDPAALNFDEDANVPGDCEYSPPGFSGLSWEEVDFPQSPLRTYRVYANFDHATEQLTAVYGTAAAPFNLSSSYPFFQHQYGGAFVDEVIDQEAELLDQDSWLSLGATVGVEQDIQTIGMSSGIDDFEDGEPLVLNSVAGGIWFVYPDSIASSAPNFPDSLGRVLIAQLTSLGQISLQANIQYKASNGDAILVTGQQLLFPNELADCTDDDACNFNPDATLLIDNCIYAEEFLDCEGECLNDTDNDGICDELEIGGCTDVLACNYDSTATDDDGSCFFDSIGTDCDGTCLLDTDGDGICEQDEIVGCQDVNACNYDSTATDLGYCDYPDQFYDCESQCLEDFDGDGICDEFEIAGCMTPAACNFNPAATDTDGSCVFPEYGLDCSGECLIDSDGDGICDQNEVVGCQDQTGCNYDTSATDSGQCIFANEGYDCDGSCLDDADGDGVCDEDEVPGCTDVSACNFFEWATDDNGTCSFLDGCGVCGGDGSSCAFDCVDDDEELAPVGGCATAVLALGCDFIWNGSPIGYWCEFSCDECICEHDFNANGVCDEDEIAGCMYVDACNFDSEATIEDGSCVFANPGFNCDGTCLDVDLDGVCDDLVIAGCTDPVACNYIAEATLETSCDYADAGYDCLGNCLNDTDDDGICDEQEASGCTDYTACNYDAAATDDDGTCAYALIGYDCNGNCLFDDDQDGICDQDEVWGCQDSTACNYDEIATDAGYCDYANAGYDCDGNCLTDADQDGVCDEFEFAGCTTNGASNYEPSATDDDGSCLYYAVGCAYSEACNYDSSAELDDGSCLFAQPGFDCLGEQLEECQSSEGCVSDIDDDGVVGVGDLLLLLSGFGLVCE